MVEPLVGKNEIILAVAQKIGHRQGDFPLRPFIGLKGAVTFAQKHQDVSELVSNQQIGNAVIIDICNGESGWGIADCDRRGGYCKMSHAVTRKAINGCVCSSEDPQVRVAVAIKVSDVGYGGM